MGILGSADGACEAFWPLCVPRLGCATQVSCKETSASITGKHFIRNMISGPKIQLQVRE